ncbi:low molecular weight protein-tyrosine-phosphatase [Laribacter hongkongensis]|uniref:protein-tyrosine-phosphatase n=1 Tax=Laribacter hongkongensis TaxID=168471 RepID=A0A248LKI2_9NEIS|nr:low molecular weight protein-tyrosine-phosphatase [Laribacter hongkongensis]ASJ25267.1 low molecular weight phosphotyrosine protein phosphatase [Laribacter hongkongensis]MCG9040669.1 low molecular weight phosphotyrosine protein phosphatase [Laribacter hongkongensis]MCG9066997.1 low molecular weight phosphotyrosine protein phosphatase [Laribacter hongkongensis]MCG9088397.1 low molecular weight phosphotyrosine protein phosphatase [Laribacter hongkongensis]MCG9108970.1 low molecular weight pho
MTPVRILFVCMGNICRSPAAEGVARAVFAAAGAGGQVWFDSAGTHAFHIGEAPDPRSQQHALRRGYDLSGLRARQVVPADFADFDWILAADRHNLAMLSAHAVAGSKARPGCMLDWAGRPGEDVPDPYYQGEAGFETVLDDCEDMAAGLLAAWRRGELRQGAA